jgi:3-oxoacyl-[acyl-carrier-protein] synthase-1
LKEVFITDYQIISPLGITSDSNFKSVIAQKSAIDCQKSTTGEPVCTSVFNRDFMEVEFINHDVSDAFTFLERLMILSIKKLMNNDRLKIDADTVLIIATTKGNIDILAKGSPFYPEQEKAYLSALGEQIKNYFNFKKDPVIVSNACISGTLAISVAKNLLNSNYAKDAVVVAGDLVSEFVISGFQSFQALSDQPCRPYSKNRKGINLGEAVASLWISTDMSLSKQGAVEVIGTGSANDANHISGPSRNGEGLFLSIRSAFSEAGISHEEIDFIGAHGTATLYNDEMEAIAMHRVGLQDKPLHSLKANFGHTLGTAGLLETIIGIESLQHNILIPSMGFDESGVSKPLHILSEPVARDVQCFLKTSSGFGGCNAAVILKKVK